MFHASFFPQCPLTLISAISLIQHCQYLDQITTHGWNMSMDDRLELLNFIDDNDLRVLVQ